MGNFKVFFLLKQINFNINYYYCLFSCCFFLRLRLYTKKNEIIREKKKDAKLNFPDLIIIKNYLKRNIKSILLKYHPIIRLIEFKRERDARRVNEKVFSC